MIRDTISRLLLITAISLTLLSQASANERSPINIQRGACANVSGDCELPFTFADVEAHVKAFETHANGTPSQAYINKDMQLGPSDLRRRDILHFNDEGELIEIWSRYRRKIGNLNVLNKLTYPVHHTGAIAAMKLYFPQFIGGKFYSDQTTLSFDANGHVLSDDFYPAPPVSRQDEITFSEKLHWFSDPLELGEFAVPQDARISVDTQGQLSSIMLKTGHWQAGNFFPPNVRLSVTDEGTVDTSDFYNRLKKNKEIQTAGGALRLLNEPLVLGSLSLPEGTLVERNSEHYTAAHLLKETDVCGIPMQGASVALQAYRRGSYSLSIKLDQDIEIQGFSLASADAFVEFHDNCSLKRAILSRAKTVNSMPLAANRELKLDRSGQLTVGTLGEPFTMSNITLPAGIRFSFEPQYSVGLMLFRGGVVTDGDRRYNSSFMQIYDNSVIAWGTLNQPTTINGKTYDRGTQLTFSPDGELASATDP